VSFYDDDQIKSVKEQKETADRHKRRELNDIRKVLSIVEGRRFIWRILSMAGVFCASYVSKDSNHTAFNEGKRDIGIGLLQDLMEAKPEAYAQLQNEFISEAKSEKPKPEEETNE